MLSIGCQEEEIFVICDGDQYCFFLLIYSNDPSMLLYFTTTRLHIVIFLKIWPFQSTLFFRHGPICNAKKLNFRFSTIFFSTSQTLSYATVSGSRFLNEYIKLQICGNCLHVENLSSSTLFIITFV